LPASTNATARQQADGKQRAAHQLQYPLQARHQSEQSVGCVGLLMGKVKELSGAVLQEEQPDDDPQNAQ